MKKALLVGIDNYKTNPLYACVKDAEELRQLLTEPDYYGFQVDIRTNEQATVSGVRRGLEELFWGAPEIALFYFSGHGVMTDLGGHLATYDYLDLDDPGLSIDILGKLVNAKADPNTSVIYILDCCHAGIARIRGVEDDPLSRSVKPDVIRQAIRNVHGRVVLAACKPDQNAYETSKDGHGKFTYHLLEGLFGEAANQDGNITPASLYDYISGVFRQEEFQTPIFSGEIAGHVVIGSGFHAVKRDVSIDDIKETAKKAHQLMDNYLKDISVARTDEEWCRSGFKEACALLEGVIDWHKAKATEFPSLKDNLEFKRAGQRISKELSQLGTLYIGINTQRGEIMDRVGSGAFGTVWKLITPDNTLLAYKAYHAQELELTDKLKRFRNGYLAMKRLDHAQVVKVYDYTDCPIGFYMDYVDGPNLRDFKDIEQTVPEILHHLLDIADTLRHAHNKGVVHRDIKPENILMRFDGDKCRWIPFLTDFDLAWFSALTRVTKAGIGEIAYAAPEQFNKAGTAISHAKTTDVYAFGQLVYFIITKTDPVPNGLQINARVLGKRLETWGNAQAANAILTIYRTCSEQEPGNRYQEFDTIWQNVYDVYQIMSEWDNSQDLTLDGFLDQVKFEIVGLDDKELQKSNRTYYSSSQKTSIVVDPRVVPDKYYLDNIDFTLSLQTQFSLRDVNFKEARNLVSRRIDDVLKDFPEASRTPGRYGQYETSIHIRKIHLSFAAATRIAQIIKRVIAVIESS